MKKWLGASLACLLVLSLFCCSAPNGTNKSYPTPTLAQSPRPTPSLPLLEEAYWPTDGWRVSTPEAHGMDSAKIAEFVKAAKGVEGYQSFLVVRDGYIVAECYFGNKSENVTSPVYSVTKSVVSALFGIAMEEGKITDINAKVIHCFTKKTFENIDARKEAMTLKHLLTMTAGLDWGITSKVDPTETLGYQEDPLEYILNMPMASEPGERFVYNNGATLLLAHYIERCVGERIETYGKEKLLDPLGIQNYQWDRAPKGWSLGFMGLRLTARDMAKFGYLFLKNGQWEGRQLVPHKWVEESTKKQTDTNGVGAPYSNAYGYQWWINGMGCYAASGYLGQHILVFPGKDIVIVIQGNFSGESNGIPSDQIPFQMMEKLLLPAIVSDSPLPENPQGYETLQALGSN